MRSSIKRVLGKGAGVIFLEVEDEAMDNQELIRRIQQRAHDPQQAIDMAEVRADVANPPVTAEQLEAAETALGFRLPEFMRQLYLQVGNGGFGPGYGLLELGDESTDDERTVVGFFVKIVINVPPPPYRPWPKQFLFIADWGCGIWSLLNWQDGRVYRFNGDMYDADNQPWESEIVPEAPSLEAWFEDWFVRPGRERFEAYR
jgi:hypothetical protein